MIYNISDTCDRYLCCSTNLKGWLRKCDDTSDISYTSDRNDGLSLKGDINDIFCNHRRVVLEKNKIGDKSDISDRNDRLS